MISEDARERMRRAYYLEKKMLRQIAREEGFSRVTIQKAISDASPQTYTMTQPRPTIVLGPYQLRVEELLVENEQLPRKQRYTSHKIFEFLQAEGYTGSESRIRQYIGAWRHTHQTPKLFLPLEYEPGMDAQCDWGEAIAIIGGVRQTVQFFVMRLCYSRRTFVMTFPSQNQESFLFAHVQAFNFFGAVHLDGVLHCLRQLTDVKEPTTSLGLSDRPDLDKVGNQPVDLSRYERLLKYNW
jgi:transposase